MTPRQLSDLASARNYYLFTIITIACGDENVHCCTLGYFRSLFFFFFFSLKKRNQKTKLCCFCGLGQILVAFHTAPPGLRLAEWPRPSQQSGPASRRAPPHRAPPASRRPPCLQQQQQQQQQPHVVRLSLQKRVWLAAVTCSFSLSLRERSERC